MPRQCKPSTRTQNDIDLQGAGRWLSGRSAHWHAATNENGACQVPRNFGVELQCRSCKCAIPNYNRSLLVAVATGGSNHLTGCLTVDLSYIISNFRFPSNNGKKFGEKIMKSAAYVFRHGEFPGPPVYWRCLVNNWRSMFRAMAIVPCLRIAQPIRRVMIVLFGIIIRHVSSW